MQEAENLLSWERFRNEVESLFTDQQRRSEKESEQISEAPGDVAVAMNPDHHAGSVLLFRGQKNADWKLQSTLEREYPHTTFTLQQILRDVKETVQQLPTHIASSFDFMEEGSYPTYLTDFGRWKAETKWSHSYFDAMTHLRHMGVPSPLLDWSRSPYVAAYLAFSDASPDQKEHVAVFHFQEERMKVKNLNVNNTCIHTLGSFRKSHERQIRQQSEYTICVSRQTNSETCLNVCSHKDYFNNSQMRGNQFEHLDKFTIQIADRAKALMELERMNITEASLFGTDDALARTLFRRTVTLMNQ